MRMKIGASLFSLALGVLLNATLFSEAVYAQEADVLAQWEDIVVTTEDVERYLRYHRPDESVVSLMSGRTPVEQYIQNILLVRYMAQQASAKGMGPDEMQMAWQLEFQRQSWLASDFQQSVVAESIDGTDWDSLAKEKYLAEPSRFVEQAKVDAAHILVKTETRTDDEAQALIEQVRERALSGEDFNELAKEYSDDKSASSNGGELGEFGRQQMVKPFSDMAFSMTEPGSISEPVKSRFGYHIIKLNSFQPEKKQPFFVVKGVLIKELKKKMASEAKSQQLIEVRSESLKADINKDALAKFKEKYGERVESKAVQ